MSRLITRYAWSVKLGKELVLTGTSGEVRAQELKLEAESVALIAELATERLAMQVDILATLKRHQTWAWTVLIILIALRLTL